MRSLLAVLLVSLTACTAHVQINSNPQGARVYVDGKQVGVTPVTTEVDYSAFNNPKVRIEKEGYEPWSGGMRTELNPGPLIAALVCPCFLPALCWVSMPTGVQTFELQAIGGAPGFAPSAPAGEHLFTIVPGVPASARAKFFSAMEAAAREHGLPVWRSEDAVQIEPEPKVTMRYVVQGDGIVLNALVPDASKEPPIRALHEKLLDSATHIAEKAKAFESAPAPAPTPLPTQDAIPTPKPVKTPRVNIDRVPQEKRCSSGVDCGPREFCKDRGDGLKLCMGNNVRGEFCVSGIDCAPALFCKDRGDGLKVCMGKGRAGDPCASGVDCEGTLRCRDPGDGFKTCM